MVTFSPCRAIQEYIGMASQTSEKHLRSNPYRTARIGSAPDSNNFFVEGYGVDAQINKLTRKCEIRSYFHTGIQRVNSAGSLSGK